jgi:F-type H+-transporting ATPase subunit b
MPQFDPAVWSPQLIWLAISFVALYFLMARVALPRISDVLEEREFKISDALRKAEGLRDDAEDAAAEYEKMMADARAKAQEEVRTVRERAAAEAAKRHAELNGRLAADIAAAEGRIAAARDEAVAGVREIAEELSAAAIERLLGEKADPKSVVTAVDASMKGAP